MGISIHQVLENQKDCLVFVLEKVYIFCQKGSSPDQKKGAEALARIMMKRKGLHEEEFEFVPESKPGIFQ